MATMLRQASSIGGVAAVIGASLLFDGSTAQAQPTSYDGMSAAACGDVIVARSAPMANRADSGQRQGTVYLMYSRQCRTVWAKIDTGAPGCVPGDDWCGSATVHRNSDGAELTCFTPRGSSTCSTGMLNDAGVTSFAEAGYDNGPWSYYGKTASF
jgi:hypothetical protein